MTDIPRSVMEEARKFHAERRGLNIDILLARFALARDKRAAEIARNRHEVWKDGDGFQDGEGLPAVSCDVTACENIADAILTYPEEKEDGL